jgi:hypothetical protein
MLQVVPGASHRAIKLEATDEAGLQVTSLDLCRGAAVSSGASSR